MPHVSSSPAEGAPADELVLTVAARSLRRALGPTAWVVQEELMSLGAAEAEAGVVVVAANLRDLADAVGLGRDAVAGALQALALAGWVRSEAARGPQGRFGAGRYLVSSNAALRRVPATPAARPPRPPRAARTNPTRPPRLPEQLSLLDLSSTPNVPTSTSATPTP